MSYSLNSLKGVIYGIEKVTTMGDISGDARSLAHMKVHMRVAFRN